MPFENYLPQLGQGALDTLPAFGDFSWRNRLAGNPQGFDESLVRSVGGALSFLGLMGVGGGLGLGPLASMGTIGALQEGSARERAVRAATMPLTAMLAGPIAGRLGAAIPEVEAGMGGLQSTLLRGARTAAVEFPGAALGATLQPAVSHAALNAMGEQQPALTRDDALRSFGEQYITGLLTHGLQTPHGEDLRTAGLRQLANLHNTLLPRDPSLLYAAAGGGAGIPRDAFPTRRSMLTPGAELPAEPKLAALTNDIPSDAASLTMARRALIAAHRLRSKIKGQTELPKIPPFLLPGRNPKEAAARDAALIDLIRAHGGTKNLAVSMSRGRWPKTPTEFRASTLEDFDQQLMDYPEGPEQSSTRWERTPPNYPDSEKRQRTDPEYREVPIDPDAPKSIHSRGGVVSPEVQADDAQYARLGWTRRHGQWVPPAPQPTPFSQHPPGTAAWWAQQTRVDPPSVSERLARIAEPTPTGAWFEPTGTTEPAMPINRPTGEDAVTHALEILKNASNPAEGRRLLLDAQQRGELTIKDIADALGRRGMSEGRLGTKMTDTYVNKERDEDGGINKYQRPVGMNIEEGNQERYHSTPLTPIESDISGFHSALNNADTVIDDNGNLVKRVTYNGRTTDLTLAEHTDLMQAYKDASIQTPMNDPSIHPALGRIGLTERHVTTLGHIADTQRIESVLDPIAERSNDTKASRGYYQQDPTLEREDRWTPLGPAYATYLKMRSLNKPGEYKAGNYTFDEFFTREANRHWGPDPFWRSAPVYAVEESRQVIDGISHFIGLTERYERWPNGDIKMSRTGSVPIGAKLPNDPSDPTGKRKLPISKVRQENSWERNTELYGGTHVMDMEFANRPVLDSKGNPRKRADGSLILPNRDAIYKALTAGKLVNLDHPLDAHKTNQFRDYILEHVDERLENFSKRNQKEFHKRANDAYNELIRNGTDPHVAISIIKELRESGNAIGLLDNMISHNLPARSIIDAINALSPDNNFGSKALTSIKVQVRNDAGEAFTEQIIGGYGHNTDYAAPQQLSVTKQRLNKWYELDPSGERSTAKNPRHRVTDMPPSGRKYVRIVDPAFRDTPPTDRAPEPPKGSGGVEPMTQSSGSRGRRTGADRLTSEPRGPIDEFGRPNRNVRFASRAVREGRPDLDARMLYPDRPARPVGTYNHTTSHTYEGIPDPGKSEPGRRWGGIGAYSTKASHDKVSYGQYKKILAVNPSARFLHLDRPLPERVMKAIYNSIADWRNGIDVTSAEYQPDTENWPKDSRLGPTGTEPPTETGYQISLDLSELERNAASTSHELMEKLLEETDGKPESFGWGGPEDPDAISKASGLGTNLAMQELGNSDGFPLDIGHIASKLGYTGQVHVGGTNFGKGPHKVLIYTDKNAVSLVGDNTPSELVNVLKIPMIGPAASKIDADATVEQFSKPIALFNLMSQRIGNTPHELIKAAIYGPGMDTRALKDAIFKTLPPEFVDAAIKKHKMDFTKIDEPPIEIAINALIEGTDKLYRDYYRDWDEAEITDPNDHNYNDQTARLHFVSEIPRDSHAIWDAATPGEDNLATRARLLAKNKLIEHVGDITSQALLPLESFGGRHFDKHKAVEAANVVKGAKQEALKLIDQIRGDSPEDEHYAETIRTMLKQALGPSVDVTLADFEAARHARLSGQYIDVAHLSDKSFDANEQFRRARQDVRPVLKNIKDVDKSGIIDNLTHATIAAETALTLYSSVMTKLITTAQDVVF